MIQFLAARSLCRALCLWRWDRALLSWRQRDTYSWVRRAPGNSLYEGRGEEQTFFVAFPAVLEEFPEIAKALMPVADQGEVLHGGGILKFAKRSRADDLSQVGMRRQVMEGQCLLEELLQLGRRGVLLQCLTEHLNHLLLKEEEIN